MGWRVVQNGPGRTVRPLWSTDGFLHRWCLGSWPSHGNFGVTVLGVKHGFDMIWWYHRWDILQDKMQHDDKQRSIWYTCHMASRRLTLFFFPLIYSHRFIALSFSPVFTLGLRVKPLDETMNGVKAQFASGLGPKSKETSYSSTMCFKLQMVFLCF